MRSEARHRLKEDQFAIKAKGTVHWAVEHRKNVIGGALIAAVIIAGSLGWWYYTTNQEERANVELGSAIRIMNAPLGTAALPGEEGFATTKQRAEAASKKFQAVADHYRHTNAGEMAQYFTAINQIDAGDNSSAEQNLKKVAAVRNEDISSVAKLALASLYISTGRMADAVPICKALVDHPTRTVSKSQAEWQLASAYEKTQPQEAAKIYRQMQAEDPTGPAAEVASSKLASLKQ